METPKRLAPTSDAVRFLFAHSGNQCAFPDCGRSLIDKRGNYVGQICHIEGVKGERFNPAMTNEQRRAADNLVLMCYDHHVETNDESVWPVERMRELKRRHESLFAQPDKLILSRIRDWTTTESLTLPRNLYGLYGPKELYDEDHDVLLDNVREYLSRFEVVPLEVRSFLASVIERMARAGGMARYHNGSSVIFAEDVRKAHRMEVGDFIRECDLLEKYGLGRLDTEERYNEEVIIYGIFDYPFWPDVLNFSKRQRIAFSSFFEGLDFSTLEGVR